MSRRLFTVEDTFLIRGRGLSLWPGVGPEGEERFRVGDALILKRPDGSMIAASIDAAYMVFGGQPRNSYPISVRGLAKQDVPIGTEVWSTDDLKTPPAAPSAPAG